MSCIKNLELEKSIDINQLLKIVDGQVVSKNVAKNSGVSISFFTADNGEEIDGDTFDCENIIFVLSGTVNAFFDDCDHIITKDNLYIINEGHEYSLKCVEPFKLLYIRLENVIDDNTGKQEQKRKAKKDIKKNAEEFDWSIFKF